MCLGSVQEVSRKCPGSVQEVSRKCPGRRLDEHEAQTTFAHRRHCLRLREVRPLMPPKTSEVRGLRHLEGS